MGEDDVGSGDCTLVPTADGEHTVRGRPWSTPGEVVEGVRLSNVKLTNIRAGLRDFAEPLPRARDLVLSRCELRASSVRCLVIEESVLDFARTSHTNLFGVLFDRTIVSGQLGALIVQDDNVAREAFVALRRGFYESVSWALDLRRASFSAAPNIRNIPGTKCLLDPATQGVAWRGPALACIRGGSIGDDHPWWPELHYSFDAASFGGQDRTDYDDLPLIVPTASRKRKRYQEGLDDLRAKGVVR